MEVLFLLGRILYALIFLMSGMGHFTQLQQMSQYAQAKGVPNPKLAVWGTGVFLLLGGLSVLLGVYPMIGLILLIVFLAPTTFIMHRFWGLTDPMQKQQEMVSFMKNLALIGAALMMMLIEAWPLSLMVK